jgi:hypothetical protein
LIEETDVVPDLESSLKHSARLRIAGILMVVFGISAACVFYWIQSRSATPSLEDTLPDYRRQLAREIGIQQGTFGVMMLDWVEALRRPGTQAIIIVASAALVGLACFRAARNIEDDAAGGA